MNIKMVHHICIQTEDYRELIDFYTRISGSEIVNESKDSLRIDYNT